MSTQIKDPNAACPFYSYEPKSPPMVVVCEGTEDDNSIKLTFRSKDDKKSYKDRYCCHERRWETCPIARGLDTKY